MTDTTASPPLWVLVAMTGAGREVALDALERAGVRCVDNLPAGLLGDLAAAARDGPLVATVDARQGEALAAVTIPDGAHVLFIDADDALLVRRQAETTLAHPCVAAGAGRAAVTVERGLLSDLRSVAEVVVEAGALPAAELGERVVAAVLGGWSAAAGAFVCTVSSFGFKYGSQVEADWVADARFLPNPFWVPELRPLTGLDPAVRAHVLDGDDGREFVERLGGLLEWVAGRSRRHGRQRLHVAVGCTGGRHRSVAVAEALAQRLRDAGVDVVVRHRDVERPDPR